MGIYNCVIDGDAFKLLLEIKTIYVTMTHDNINPSSLP